MSALPPTVGGLSVNIPVGNVQRALTIAKLSSSNTVSITTSLEWMVDADCGMFGGTTAGLRLLAKRRCRLMWNLVMDRGIRGWLIRGHSL